MAVASIWVDASRGGWWDVKNRARGPWGWTLEARERMLKVEHADNRVRDKVVAAVDVFHRANLHGR